MDLEQFEVHIVEYQHTTLKSRYIIGYILLHGKRYDFNALAYESHAGPNVNANFEAQARSDLTRSGLNEDSVEALLVNLQRKLIEGELTMDFDREASESA